MTGPELVALLGEGGARYGVWVLVPLAVLEGPVISLLTGWLIALGMIPAPLAFVIILLGDVAGDVLLYAIGRGSLQWLGRRLPTRLRPSRRRMAGLIRKVRRNDARLLIGGKLTHIGGFAVLLAAGAARVPVWRFLWLNTLAAAPKAAALLALGWAAGTAATRVAEWLAIGGQVGLLVLAAGLLGWVLLLWLRKLGQGRRIGI